MAGFGLVSEAQKRGLAGSPSRTLDAGHCRYPRRPRETDSQGVACVFSSPPGVAELLRSGPLR
jgi:hypothetical protein